MVLSMVVYELRIRLETLYPNLGHLLLTQNNKNKAIICGGSFCILELYWVGLGAEARLSTYISRSTIPN